MRSLLALLFVALLAAAMASKKDVWEDLEDIMQDADASAEDEDAYEKDKVSKKKSGDSDATKNPCEGYHCGWGKECVLDKKQEPKCVCAKECPMPLDTDPYDKVCSDHNETFPTLCHLYQQKCLCKHGEDGCTDAKHAKVHLEYLGGCKQLDECSEDMMLQFPERMSDWLFQVMKEMKKRQELDGPEWLSMLDEAEVDEEYKHVYPVLWKFCDLDIKPHDRTVSHHELIPITAPVIPMESCIKPFLQKCDTDDDNQITLKEWGKCLGLKDDEISNRC